MEPKSNEQMYEEGKRHAEVQKAMFDALPPLERIDLMLAVAGSYPNKEELQKMAGAEENTIQDEELKKAIEQRFQSAKIVKDGKTLYGFSGARQEEILNRLGPDVATAARRQITGFFRERLIPRIQRSS